MPENRKYDYDEFNGMNDKKRKTPENTSPRRLNKKKTKII